MSFDFDAYLANKAAAASKLQAVADASREKISELQAYDAAKPKSQGNSWSEQLGLEPGTFISNRVNDAASLIAGASRVAGQVASLPVSLAGLDQTSVASQADTDAWNRYKAGQATPEDLAQLERKPSASGPTMMERFQLADKARPVARAINDTMDLSSIVDPTNRRGLTADLAKDFQPNWDKVKSGETGQVVSGLAGLLVNAGSALLNNPSAVREYILENAPQLFVGAAGKAGQAAMLASNVGYAVDEFQKGMEEFAKANGGALPPVEQQQTMALQAASLALAEQIGDVIGLRAAGAIGRGTEDAARTSFMQSMKNVRKAGTEGFASEAPTEGFQTYMEGQIEGKPKTAEEIYAAGAIGGASGGGLAGGGRTVAELTKSTPEHAQERDKARQQGEALNAAMQSGDVSVFSDPKSKDYAPAQAIAALHGHSQQATDDATKQANLAKADEILNTLQGRRQEVANRLLSSDEKQARIGELKQKIAGSEQSDPELAQMYREELALSEKELARAEDPKAVKEARATLAKIDAELAQARQNRAALGTLVTPQEQIDGALETLKDASKAPDHQGAADKIITLAMTAPDRVDPQVAGKLAADTQNGLSDAQRGYLRQFSEARLAAIKLLAPDMHAVSQAIYLGNKKKGDVGIAQYRAGITASLAAGDRAGAFRQLAALQRFAEDHSAKAAAAREAQDQGFGSQIQRTKAGEWFVASPAQNLSPSALQTNGGLAIKSSKLVADIGLEAEAITLAAQEMRTAFSMQPAKGTAAKASAQPKAEAAGTETSKPTNSSTTSKATGADDVQNPTQGTGTQPKPEAPAAKDPAAAGAGSTTTGAGAVSDKGAGTGEAQAARVTPEPAETTAAPAAPVARDSQNEGTSGSSVSTTAADSQSKSTETSSQSSAENQSTEKNTAEQPSTAEQQQPKAEEPSPSVTDATDASAQADTPVPEAGKLSSLTDKSPEGTVTPFQHKKLGDFLTQSAGKEGDKAYRPLVAAKDFLSQLASAEDKRAFLTQYLGFDPTAQQLSFIELFQELAQDLAPMITESLFKGDKAEYFYKDWMQALVQDTGKGLDLEENVKTAIAYAVFSWAIENATQTTGNDDEEINAILGRPDEHPVDDYERMHLEDAGTRQNLVINTLGQRIVQALGMKAVKDAPDNILPDLAAAMGAHALKLLVNNGMVVRENIPGDVMAELTERADTNTEASNYFVKVATAGAGADNVKELAAKAIGMQGVVDKLFGVESGMKEPELDPIDFNQARTKGTQQGVPSKLAEAAEHDNKTPFKVREDMWSLFQQLSRGALAYIAGAQDPASKMLVNERKIEAKNRGFEREIDNFMSFVSSMKDVTANLFFEHTVMKQQRVHITTTLINPQSSKVHRHALYRDSWTTEIDTSNAALMNGFKLRVLEGLGVKTDKQTNKTSLAGFNAMFDAKLAKNDKDAAKAKARNAGVRVLVEMLEGKDMTEAKEDLLVAAVAAGGEKMHSLDALMAVAHWKFAEKRAKAGEPVKFTTQLMGEVDGVTNGPMLSHLLMGAADSVKKLFSLLNRGGFFEQGNAHSQYNAWRSIVANRDLYENTTAYVTTVIQRYVKDGILTKNGKTVPWSKNMGPVMDAVYAFTGELSDKDGRVTKDGRNIIKTPLTAMMFGSSVPGAVNSMANKFVEAIFAKIEDSAADKEGSLDAAEIIDHINLLLSIGSFKVGPGPQDYDTAPSIPRNLTIDDLMGRTQRNFRFSSYQILGLKSALKNTIGRAVAETMEKEFSTFIEQRKQLNEAAQLAFTLFNATRTAMRDQLLNELMDKEAAEPGTGVAFYVMTEVQEDVPAPKGQEAPADKRKREAQNRKNAARRREREQYAALGYRVPLHDLNSSQLRELDRRLFKVAPTMHTYMSGISGGKDPLAAGLAISKTERKLAQSRAYEGEIKFGSKFGDHGMASTRVKAMERVLASPGVGMVPLSVHSSDSAVSHLALLGFDPLNVHDAHGTGVGNFEETAKRLNKSLWDVMLGYSPATEMSAALSRTVQGLSELAASGKLPPEATKAMAQAVAQLVAQQNERAIKAGKPATLDAKTYLREAFVATRKAAAHADRIKFGAMAQMAWLDQYALEGGNHEVSDADRAKAAEYEKQVSHELTAEEKAALDLLEKALAKELGEVEEDSRAARQRESDESTADINQDQAPAKPGPFGQLGTGRNDPEIAAFFAQNPNTTAKAAMKFLFAHLAKQPAVGTRDFSAKLLRKLAQILPPDLPVVLITADTKESDVLGVPEKPARGWFVPQQKGRTEQAIYVTGPDFAQSNLKAEVLLHELVHAATHIRLHSPEAKQYLAELEMVLEAVRKYVADRGMKGYDAPLSNVDELIAYGMTNQKFQQMVLAQVKVDSRVTKTNTSAMKAFVTTIARLLGFKDTESANALGVLFANVAAVMGQDTGTKEQSGAVLSMAAEANTYSTMDILDGLADGSVGPAFQAHLREILGGIVEKLHGPFGSFKAQLMENQALSPLDVWLKALDTGKAAFASQTLASSFKVSSQEAFAIEQVEATVKAALNASEARTKMAYRELGELYAEVYRNAKAADFHEGDWATASQVEKDVANELYEFVFKMEKSSGDRSDYLARFAALGLAHQGFNRVLQRATERNTRKASDAKGFAERLQIIFENILDFFRSKMTHTYGGQAADVKLKLLVGQLVDIEAKNRFRLVTEGSSTTLVEKLEAQGKELNRKLGEGVEKILNSSFLRNNGNAFVRGAGAVARTVAGNRVDTFLESIARIRDEHLEERHGWLASLIGEAKGPAEEMKFALLATKHNEKIRKDIIDAASNTALSVFANGGQDLTEEAKAAISQTFLRSGAHALLDHFTMAQLEGLLADPQQLQAAITRFEGQLTGNAKGYWMHQAKALGYYKATGKVTSQLMMTNAGNIARMFGTSYQEKMSAERAQQAEAILNPLISLYALSYLSPETRQQAAATVKTENERTDGHGIEFVLKLHKRLETESRDRNFDGSPELMMHGYTPEIFNPYTEVQVADEVAGQELVDRGWSKGAEVSVDPHDPDRQRRHVYVLRGAGLQARLTGIMSFTGMDHKGSEKHSGYLNPLNQNGLANAQLNADVLTARQDAVKRMFTAGASFDPTKVGTTFMAPIVNPRGDIVNWRYLMQEDTKDTLLERDNRFEHLLGALAGSIFDKESTAEQNKKAMQALKEQYDAEYAKHSDRYIFVGPSSTDADLRESWHLLPEQTKRDVRRIWGHEGVYVRKDALDIIFGYRKLSAARMFRESLDARQRREDMGLPASLWDLDNEEYNILQKLAIMTVETMLTVYARTQGMNQQQAEAYSKRAATVITRSGRMWSEVVAETKDLIVVKTGTVLLGNIWSNLSLLVINGVPLKDIVHHHTVALKGATSYHADSEELARLRLLLDSGHTLGKEAQIKRDILRLEDAIARNPITKLVDAGLMPTIVEDIATEDDIYSYKSALVNRAEGITSKLPESVRNMAKTIYMTHDTPLYQGLSRVTQLSDFVARYTLYQHLISRKNDPMSEKEAISRAVDSFIMYDVPMHPMLQYADDTGVFMFTKYFLRIQRVLRAMYHDNPARVLAALLLDHTLGLGPIVLDSAAAFRIGNPLQTGAFKIFGSLDELATVKPVISVFGGGRDW